MNQVHSVFHDAISDVAKALGDLSLTDKEIDRAVDLIADSKSPLVTTGVGKSGFIAAKVAATMSSLGMPALFLNATDALHGDLGIVYSGAPALLFSNSGNTPEIVALLPALADRDCAIISITGNIHSRIAERSAVCLCFGRVDESDEHGLAPTKSTSMQLAIGDALAIAASRRRSFSKEEFLRNHPAGALGKRLMSVRSAMRSGDAVPTVRAGSLLTDALLEMSAKKIGIVCVTDPDGILGGIVTDGDIRRALQNRIDVYHVSVDSLMRPDPITTLPETMVGDLLQDRGSLPSHLSLPVIDHNKRLLGIIVGLDLL